MFACSSVGVLKRRRKMLSIFFPSRRVDKRGEARLQIEDLCSSEMAKSDSRIAVLLQAALFKRGAVRKQKASRFFSGR